jgi:hypothetical protein
VKRLRCRLSPRERRPIGTLESYPQLLARQRLDQKSTVAALPAPGFSRSPYWQSIRQSARNVLKEKTGAGFGSHPFGDTHFVFTGGPFMHDFVGQFPVLAAFSERTEKQRNASICILSKERVTSRPLLRISLMTE